MPVPGGVAKSSGDLSQNLPISLENHRHRSHTVAAQNTKTPNLAHVAHGCLIGLLVSSFVAVGSTHLSAGPPGWQAERPARSENTVTTRPATKPTQTAETSQQTVIREPRLLEPRSEHSAAPRKASAAKTKAVAKDRKPLAESPLPLGKTAWLEVNPITDNGESPYVLVDQQGRRQRYVEPVPSVELTAYLGQQVGVVHDTGRTLLASQLDLPSLELARPQPLRAITMRERSGVRSISPVQYETNTPTSSTDAAITPLDTLPEAPSPSEAISGYETDASLPPIVIEELPAGELGTSVDGLVNPEAIVLPDAPLEGPYLDTNGPVHLDAVDHGSSCGPDCPSCKPKCHRCGGDVGWRKMMGCHLGEPWSLRDHLICQCSPVNFGGWLQAGYHTEQTPLSTTFSDIRAFNDVPDQLNLHQAWLFFERQASGQNGLELGYRLDVMYGTDAQKTQSFGNDDARWDSDSVFDHGEYGFAAPQFYAEVAGRDWSVILGKFFTIAGYEAVTAPDNFFYSHSLTMFNSEPFTHTGALATYRGIDRTEIYGGYTLGWDTGFDQAFGGSTFLGGFKRDVTDYTSFTYVTTVGNLGFRSVGADAYTHSLVLDVAVTQRLNYVLQSDLVAFESVGGTLGNDKVGINQYLIHRSSDCWATGIRFEWWKSDGQSFYEATAGINYKPHANVLIRPEIRYDWTPSAVGYTDGRDDEVTLGIDATLLF